MPAGAVPAVLLVEDNLDDVLLTQRAFRKGSVSASLQVVGDGEQAVEYLAGTGCFSDREAHPQPSLVLLDWKLPRRSGLEVLQWIRSQTEMATLAVVVLTSSRETEDLEQAYAAGANSYLEKPVQFDGLLDLVTRLDLYWLQSNLPSSVAHR